MSIHYLAEAYADAWSSSQPDAVVALSGEFPDLSVRLDHARVAADDMMFGWILEGQHCAESYRPGLAPGRAHSIS